MYFDVSTIHNKKTENHVFHQNFYILLQMSYYYYFSIPQLSFPQSTYSVEEFCTRFFTYDILREMLRVCVGTFYLYS